jgi:hypothetical protein
MPWQHPAAVRLGLQPEGRIPLNSLGLIGNHLRLTQIQIATDVTPGQMTGLGDWITDQSKNHGHIHAAALDIPDRPDQASLFCPKPSLQK